MIHNLLPIQKEIFYTFYIFHTPDISCIYIIFCLFIQFIFVNVEVYAKQSNLCKFMFYSEYSHSACREMRVLNRILLSCIKHDKIWIRSKSESTKWVKLEICLFADCKSTSWIHLNFILDWLRIKSSNRHQTFGTLCIHVQYGVKHVTFPPK